MTSIQPKWQNYINGAFVPGSEGNLSVENPATGEHLAWQASAGTDDVDQAVAAARACVDEGRLT
ncbi:MAG: aldehyde dehydrogenase, partial [Pseudomonadota bacterium]